MITDRGQKAKHTFVRHLQALRLVRTRRAIRQIPDSTPLRLARHYQHYAVVACAQLGRRRLARVSWPWERVSEPQRPPSMQRGRWARLERIRPADRVKRGRLANPTALR